MKRISEDKRPIKRVWRTFEGYGDAGWTVGVGGVTKIEAYQEPGEGAMVPWFAVYFGDSIRWRIPAHMVTVEYAE